MECVCGEEVESDDTKCGAVAPVRAREGGRGLRDGKESAVQ